ncbi:MAG: Rieske (2Fe-2S) protein [Micromonosporaceae bacterium]
MTGANRRAVLLGAGAVGVSAAVAACGGDDNTATPGATESPTDASSPTPEDTGGPLAKVSDVPVGGGVVLGEQGVVVTQPKQGEFKGFSSTCTHRGCTVKDVAGGTINCECHGSKFAVADGAVKNGPATKALPAVEIKVEGEEILRA